MEEMKINDIITDIGKGVHALEQMSKNANVPADEVRRIKRSFLNIRGVVALCSEEEHPKHQRVLEFILDCVNQLVENPVDIGSYADSIENCVERLSDKNTNDDKYADIIFQMAQKLDQFGEKIDSLSEIEVGRTKEAEYIGGDIKKIVEISLESNPPDFNSAHAKIRACIENYCRYEKGVDLNDSLLTDGLSAREKFALAKIDENILDQLSETYKLAHKFVHDDRAYLRKMTDSEKMKCTVNAVDLLKQWRMDEFDEKRGTAKLYLSRDMRLKQLIDNTDERELDERLKKFGNGYFQRMREYEERLKADDIVVPDVIFKNKKDVYDYLNAKKTNGNAVLSVKTDSERFFEWHAKEAEKGNFDSCVWLGLYYDNIKDVKKACEWFKYATDLEDADNKIKHVPQRSYVGRLLYCGEEYSAALKWIGDDQDNPKTLIVSGDCYYFKSNYEEAIRRYRLVDASLLTEDRQKKLVADSIRFTEPEAALKYYKLCKNADSDLETVKCIGDCYLMTGDFKTAFSAYDKILFKEKFKKLGGEIAETLANNVRYEQVAAYIKESKCNDTLIVKKIADVFHSYGKESLAVEWYENCDIKSLPAQLQKQVGDSFIKKGERGKAVDYYLAYVIAEKDYIFAKTTADGLWNNGYKEVAVKLYEVYAQNNRSVTITRLLADYYYSKGFSLAIQWYEKYYQLSRDDNEDVVRILIQLHERTYTPKNALVWYKILGNKLYSKGKVKEAVEVYSEYSKSCFDDYICNLLLEYYFENQEWDSALKYSKLIHNNNDKTQKFEEKAARRNIAICEKISESCKYAKTRTNCSDVLNRWTKTLGDLLYAKGDNEGALAEYLKYNDPKCDCAVFGNIVKCYLNLGEVEKANEWYVANGGLCQDSNLIKRLGDACFKSKNAQYAVEYYERYCEIEEDKAAKAYHRGCKSVAEAEKILNTLQKREGGLGTRSFEEYSRLQGFKRYFSYEDRAKYSEAVRRLESFYHEAGNSDKEREMLIKLGDILRCNGDHRGAVDAYNKAGLNNFEPDYTRELGYYYFEQGNLIEAEAWFEKSWEGKDFKLAQEVGDLYFGKGYKAKACAWFVRAWQGNKTADLARLIGNIYFDAKQLKEACDWYLRSYMKKEDPELAVIIGDYYFNNGNQDEACAWYERSLEGKCSEELQRLLGTIYDQCGQKERALELHELYIKKYEKSFLDDSLIERIGDGFYQEGATAKAERCYVTLKNGESRIKLKLAECYYYSSDYDNAQKALSAYAKKTVKVHTGFAFAANGTLFIAFDKHLIPVERSMVKKLKLKSESGKKKTAEICLNFSAPKVLPKKITLFTGLDENDASVKTLAEVFGRKKKNVRISKKLLKPTKPSKIRTRRSFGDAVGLTLVAAVGLIGLYIALSYAFADSDGFTHWFWIVGIPFVINTFITKFACKDCRRIAGRITWGILVLQYIINVVLQWWLWLDPNDGDPAVGEFVWYGIMGPILSTCLFALIYFLTTKVFTNDK